MGNYSVTNSNFHHNCITFSPFHLESSLRNDKKTVNDSNKSEEVDSLLRKSKIGRVYSAEYTKVPKAFFTPHP
jgi:hypothetical protein